MCSLSHFIALLQLFHSKFSFVLCRHFLLWSLVTQTTAEQHQASQCTIHVYSRAFQRSLATVPATHRNANANADSCSALSVSERVCVCLFERNMCFCHHSSSTLPRAQHRVPITVSFYAVISHISSNGFAASIINKQNNEEEKKM